MHVSGQLQTGSEKLNISASTGTIVHVMHVLFVLVAVFENLKVSFSQINLPEHASKIFI